MQSLLRDHIIWFEKCVYQKGGVGVINHPSEERHQNIITGC